MPFFALFYKKSNICIDKRMFGKYNADIDKNNCSENLFDIQAGERETGEGVYYV